MRYQCPHCEYSATREHKLAAHIVHHVTKYEFCCDICGYSSKSSRGISIHKTAIHAPMTEWYDKAGKKSNRCPYCTKALASTRPADLMRHIQILHTKEALYQCNKCGLMTHAIDHIKLHIEKCVCNF